MRTQFIVRESDLVKREDFYNYIINSYELNIWYPYEKAKFVNNKFPFVIDFKEKSFWICESITCCACAAQAKVMFTIDQFKEKTALGLALKRKRKEGK